MQQHLTVLIAMLEAELTFHSRAETPVDSIRRETLKAEIRVWRELLQQFEFGKTDKKKDSHASKKR